jgi:multidrug transporter EmrE-like cation transporter
VLAYALVSFEVLSSNGLAYQILNGTGALGILIISIKKKAYQPGVLNIIWFIIAVVAIIQILK